MLVIRYRRRRFPAKAIFYAVWPYFRFPPSPRMAGEMPAAHGIVAGQEAIRRWAERFASSAKHRAGSHRRPWGAAGAWVAQESVGEWT
jgi:transposase-like protein